MKETDNDPDNDEWAEAVAMFAKYEHAQKADNQDILDFIKTVGAGQDCETAKMFVARITRQARELCSKHNQAI